jgi:hypothetical protein
MPRNFSLKQILAILLLIVGVLLLLFLGLGKHTTKKPVAKTSEVSNTLNDSLPIQTSDYRIDYDYNPTSKAFSYQITLYAILNRPSQYDSYIAQLKQFKQEALSYISQHGGNPSNLSIVYIPDTATSL